MSNSLLSLELYSSTLSIANLSTNSQSIQIASCSIYKFLSIVLLKLSQSSSSNYYTAFIFLNEFKFSISSSHCSAVNYLPSNLTLDSYRQCSSDSYSDNIFLQEWSGVSGQCLCLWKHLQEVEVLTIAVMEGMREQKIVTLG